MEGKSRVKHSVKFKMGRGDSRRSRSRSRSPRASSYRERSGGSSRDREREKEKERERESSGRRDRDSDRHRSSRKRSRRERSPSRSPSKSSGKRRRRRSRSRSEGRKSKRRRDDDTGGVAASAALLAGYSDETNPFGDSNLAQTFVWKKKVQSEREEGRKVDTSRKGEKARKEELQREILKAKSRREEREMEKQLMEEQRALLDRERNLAQFQDWEEKEIEFHYKQARKRSEIRIREGRAKPIDVIYKNLQLDPEFDFDVHEPYEVFRGLTLEELVQLNEDIRMYLELDEEKHKQFWKAMLVVSNDTVQLLAAQTDADVARGQGGQAAAAALAAANAIVEQTASRGHRASRLTSPEFEREINDLFAEKEHAALVELEEEVLGMINQGGAVDMEYWEEVLRRLQIVKAKAKLREIHKEILEQRLGMLESQHNVETSQLLEEKMQAKKQRDEELAELERIEDELEQQERRRAAAAAMKQAAGTEAEYDAVAEEEATLAARSKALESRANELIERSRPVPSPAGATEEDSMMKQEAAKAMEEDEEVFAGAEVEVAGEVYSWDEKYRPRKPKYFNRIRAGYDWNRYNQTHYDQDNPPPKIVQGYKFNVFYPDLIDKSVTPTFHVTKSTDDTTLIRFHAGPPYEDIAFRIVNKPWDHQPRRGYKCVFDRGILHVWFNFKHLKYNR